ncbi:glycosyltransferase family 4 protein [Alteromonas halophila]|uniref:Glycosyltransferase family 1 protein n=1 Tax=Alteromonas halophila TaxID=516698 RepID=A0A918JL31_9ALTE|nr:glycosyltransferase family 4 protein [Alteromonas halophila]GGW86905.1 glycosyltransferase family 1 protein [Alteromonas halophila]
MHLSSTPSKIIHVVSSLNVGGAERFVIDLCQVQQKQGYQVSILSLGNQHDELVEEAGHKGITANVVSQVKGWRLLQSYRLLVKADIIHFHSPHAIKLFSPIIGALQKRIMVYTRHGAAPLHAPHWQRLHKKIRPFVNAITFVSNEGKQNFQSIHAWSGLPMEVIDNGIDIDAINVTDNRRDSTLLRLGSVGRMVKLKGQHFLLEAIAGLTKERRQRVTVEFFGDGECRKELQQFAQTNLPDTRITFHGMVDNRDDIYNAFDVMCVTSETEGLSLAVIEAMAYKKAVVATNVGGNPKLVEHDTTGWLFEYADTETLKTLINKLIDEPTLAQKMGANGREKVAQAFSLNITADKFNQLYLPGE